MGIWSICGRCQEQHDDLRECASCDAVLCPDCRIDMTPTLDWWYCADCFARASHDAGVPYYDNPEPIDRILARMVAEGMVKAVAE